MTRRQNTLDVTNEVPPRTLGEVIIVWLAARQFSCNIKERRLIEYCSRQTQVVNEGLGPLTRLRFIPTKELGKRDLPNLQALPLIGSHMYPPPGAAAHRSAQPRRANGARLQPRRSPGVGCRASLAHVCLTSSLSSPKMTSLAHHASDTERQRPEPGH